MAEVIDEVPTSGISLEDEIKTTENDKQDN
jgi:hypothetical protein